MKTSQITIRGVDEATKKRLLARARASGLSLNAYNLKLLQRSTGTHRPNATNGLERFAGTMEYDSGLEKVLRDQRGVNAGSDKINKFLDGLS